MRDADVGDEADLRLGQVREISNLAFSPHAEFDDDGLVEGVEFEQGEGQADFVVEVRPSLHGAPALGENGGEHILGGSFTDAAGEADDDGPEGGAVSGGDFAEGAEGVLDDDLGAGQGKLSRDEEGAGAGGEGLGGEVVTVETLPRDGEVEFTGAQRSGIYGDARGSGGKLTADDASASGGEDLSQGHLSHYGPQVRVGSVQLLLCRRSETSLGRRLGSPHAPCRR